MRLSKFQSVYAYAGETLKTMKTWTNPYWDQMHRTTRIPEFSVVSVLGAPCQFEFVQK